MVQYTITLNDDGSANLPVGRSDVAEWCRAHNKYLQVRLGEPTEDGSPPAFEEVVCGPAGYEVDAPHVVEART